MKNHVRTLAVSLLFACIAPILSGCDFFGTGNVAKDAPVLVKKDSAVTDAGKEYDPLFAADGKGNWVMRLDVQPQGAMLEAKSKDAREVYLTQRVFAYLDHRGAKLIPKDANRLIAEVVMMTSLDQYNKLGTPEKIATFEIDLAKFRQEGKTAKELEGHHAQYFLTKSVTHDNIKFWPIKRITLK